MAKNGPHNLTHDATTKEKRGSFYTPPRRAMFLRENIYTNYYELIARANASMKFFCVKSSDSFLLLN